MLAAGGPLEPFWQMYSFHKNEQIKSLLKPYKIGILHPDDVLKADQLVDFSDLHKDDIIRSPNLVKHQDFPFCAETNRMYLTDHLITPSDELYIRNHYLVPSYDEDFEEEFELEFSLGVKDGAQEPQVKAFSLQRLKSMCSQEVMTYIACAGNRRKHTRKVFSTVKGVNWDMGAIGNNMYRGVLVRDLLLKSGYTEQELASDDMKSKHLVATGMDQDFQGEPFKVSIPLERALDPKNKVILAWEMDGKALTKDHGYPLRLVVPGYIGVRNCKWVEKLEISDEEADSCMQRRDYKLIKEKDWTQIDYGKYPSIMANVPNSCISCPADGESVSLIENDGKLALKGWATGDGENGIPVSQVQISLDSGSTWRDAELAYSEKP